MASCINGNLGLQDLLDLEEGFGTVVCVLLAGEAPCSSNGDELVPGAALRPLGHVPCCSPSYQLWERDTESRNFIKRCESASNSSLHHRAGRT